jgi:hypothetical protein
VNIPDKIEWPNDKFPQMYITIEYLDDDWCLPESISTS